MDIVLVVQMYCICVEFIGHGYSACGANVLHLRGVHRSWI